MADIIEYLNDSLIQHGKENDRIYLIKLGQNVSQDFLNCLNNLAINNSYTKIIAKVPEKHINTFFEKGYKQEAYIPNFYNGKNNVYFLSKYFSKTRQYFKDKSDILNNIQISITSCKLSTLSEISENITVKLLQREHIPQMIKVYQTVFKSYPFPIFDGNYILKTMNDNIDYYGIFDNNNLIATSSSEMDLRSSNTEMTDFAVMPSYRGKNLSYFLLKKMQKEAINKGIKTTYTIARAKNIGINKIFAKMSYKFGGTLVNNTNICGDIETMNVWYKNL